MQPTTIFGGLFAPLSAILILGSVASANPTTQPQQVATLAADAHQAMGLAKEKAALYLNFATARCLDGIKQSPEWIAAEKRRETLDAIAANTVGDPDIQRQAKASAAAARAQIVQIQDAALDKDASVQDAKQMVAMFSPAPAAPANPMVTGNLFAPPAAETNTKLKDRAASLIAAENIKGAIEVLEQIQSLEPSNEDNLLKLAACHIRDKNPMRAAKFLKEYEDRVSGREAVQNALGIALSRVDKWNDLYWTYKSFYTGYDEQLAAGRNDGKARWGAEWIPAQEAAAKWDEAIAAQRNLVAAGTAVDQAQAALDKLKQQQADANSRTQTPFTATPNMDSFANEIWRAQRSLVSAQENLTAAQNRYDTSQPTFPNIIDGMIVP